MRYSLCSILLYLLCNPIFSQEFMIEDSKVIWQNIYETDLVFQDLLSEVKKKGIIKEFNQFENSISGEFEDVDADYKGLGYSEMLTPIYVARSYFSGTILIEFKENRYRVTLRNLILTQKYDDAISKGGEKTSLDFFALKKNKEFKKMFLKAPSEILNHTFINLFTIKKKEDDDWE